MKTITDNLTPEEAWRCMSAQAHLGPEMLPLEEAFDHVLQCNLLATENVPVGPRSFRDGFAVNSKDLSAIPALVKVVADIAMGEIPSRSIQPGEAMSIPTGGFLPEGADAVVMVE